MRANIEVYLFAFLMGNVVMALISMSQGPSWVYEPNGRGGLTGHYEGKSVCDKNWTYVPLVGLFCWLDK